MSQDLEADYIVVGGGLAGCALASRLIQTKPAPSILLFEAGPDPSPEHDVDTLLGGFALQGSALDWQYTTKPVPETAGRTHVLTAAKTLGGGSVLNFGGWSRGDAADYDTWARLIGDERWSYAGLLPSFRRSERWADAGADATQHGFDGPMRVTTVMDSDPKRRYPLSGPLRAAWKELGVGVTARHCAGLNFGLDEFHENWKDGHRQSAHRAYPLDGVSVHTGTPVAKLLFADNSSSSVSSASPAVTGVLLQDGRTVRARKEVVLCAGALRTPPLLHASGVGPAPLLESLKVPIVHNAPAVGAGYFDHFALFQLWKLHPHSTGLSLGHPDLADPALVKGLPADCVVNEGLPRAVLEKALDADGVTGEEREALLQLGRCFVESLVMYHPLAPGVPVDGSWVSTSVMLTLPSSRGKVALSAPAVSAAADKPDIEPNYFSTALDRAALVHGVRRMLQLMLATAALRPYVAAEVPPPGLQALTVESSDAEIEDRIRAGGVAHFHAAGSCSVGTALDPELRVRGLSGVRVCDASVFPGPVGGHPQASLYGVAELAADMITQQS